MLNVFSIGESLGIKNPLMEMKNSLDIDLFIKEKTTYHETQIIKKLESNYIPAYFVKEGNVFIIKGDTDLDKLLSTTIIEPIYLTQFFYQITFALYDLHLKIGYHRDIKPQNIIIYRGPPPYATLIDFDKAKEANTQTDSYNTLYSSTPQYEAPEAAHGRYYYASDIYMLGMTLFHMVTTKWPYPDLNRDVFLKYKKENILQPSLPPTLSYDVECMIRFLCRSNPIERPSDNLLLVILHEKKFSFPNVYPSNIPTYQKATERNQINIKDEDNIENTINNERKYLMTYDEIDDFCEEFFGDSNLNLSRFSTAKEVRRFLKMKLNESKYDKGNKRDLQKIRRYNLINEIIHRISTEPLVASLFYEKCYQKSNCSNYTSSFNAQNSFDQYSNDGPIALDPLNNLKEELYHLQKGRFLNYSLPQQMKNLLLSSLKKVNQNQEPFSEDNQEFNLILGQLPHNNNINKAFDFTSYFKNSIKYSPISKYPNCMLSESAILQYYYRLVDATAFYTKKPHHRSKYPSDKNMLSETALFPIFGIQSAHPFCLFAYDKHDLIYYTNTVINKSIDITQSSEYLIFRFMFMFVQLFKGKYVNTDYELASEYSRLIPLNGFELQRHNVIKPVVCYIQQIYNSIGAAYDKREILVLRKLLNAEEKTEIINGQPPYVKGHYILSNVRNIINNQKTFNLYFKNKI